MPRSTPPGSGCLDGTWINLDSPACAVPTPTPTPLAAPQLNTTIDTSTCNEGTWLRCAMDAAEISARISAGDAGSPCTRSYAQCWAGADTTVWPAPAGSGCLAGLFVNLAAPDCAALAPLQPTDRRLASEGAVAAVSETRARRAAAAAAAPCAAPGTTSCPSQCGATVQWCDGAGTATTAATPAGTLCFATGDDVAFVSVADDRCAPLDFACPALSAPAAVCFNSVEGVAVAAGSCGDSYVVCAADVDSEARRAPAPLLVPAGTSCLDGTLVLAASCAGSAASTAVAAVSVVAAAGGMGAAPGPAAAAAVAAGLASALATTTPPLSIALSDVTFSIDGAPLAQSQPLLPLPAGPPLPGVPILPAGAGIGGTGVGATTITITIAGADADAIAAALVNVTAPGVSGVTPVAAALAAARLPIVLSGAVLAPSP